MKKLLVYLGTIVLGAVIVTLIDNLIGVNFNDIGAIPQIVHRVIYMGWGGIIIGINKWLEG